MGLKFGWGVHFDKKYSYLRKGVQPNEMYVNVLRVK